MIELANTILIVCGAYLAVGLVCGIAFVSAGIAKVDHAAHAAPWSFRLLILPGVVALWPVMLRKWLKAAKGMSG